MLMRIDSNIFDSLDDIDFIIEKLSEELKYKNRKLFLDLLYKASKDGKMASDFHKKCNGKVQQLVFIKTVKGEIFGGCT